jgi:hypothetical protein
MAWHLAGFEIVSGATEPFIWTADPDAIIEKVRRGKKVLASIG